MPSAASPAANRRACRGLVHRHPTVRRFAGYPDRTCRGGALSLGFALLALLVLPAHAADPAATAASAPPSSPAGAMALQAQSLAASCAACHGTVGQPAEGSTMPALAGLPAGYLGEQMRAFKSGARPATVMHQIAKGYSDPQIDRLAAYFAAQTKALPK